MGNATIHSLPEKNHGQRKLKTGEREVSQKKKKYLSKVKKTDEEVLKLRSPKELKTNGKPNSPTSESINSINRDMPRGHNPRSTATTHLRQHMIPRVTQKKNSSSSIVVIGPHDDQRIGGN